MSNRANPALNLASFGRWTLRDKAPRRVGGFQHFTFAALVALNPLVVPAILLGAYILGFHLCLPTNFGGSAVVAALSTIASVAVIFGLRAVA